MPQVEVTFDVDANGILNVTAKDKTTGKVQTIRIEASSGLAKEEVEKMQKEAEAHAAEDAEKKLLIDAKNTAEHLVYSAEKALKDAPTIPDDIKKGVEEKITNLKKEKDSGTLDSIKLATETLSTEMQKIGQYMSQNPQGGAQPTTEPEVKEAEISEEKPKDEGTPNG
jgi:molecular chaperone DnaK